MNNYVSLSCEGLGVCRVVHVRGLESMNALPSWTADVLADEADVDLDSLGLARATLRLADDGDGPPREIPLVVTHAAYDGPYRDEHRYVLELSADTWPLTLRSGYRIFQHKTTQEIIDEVLRDAGVPPTHLVWRLGGRYARRVQCVQYDESEWMFIERLLADEGISYWFDAHEGEPRIVFGDAPGSHEGILGEVRVPFADASGMSGTDR